VEEVLKSNRDVVEAESFWVWTIELLREAIHPDVVGRCTLKLRGPIPLLFETGGLSVQVPDLGLTIDIRPTAFSTFLELLDPHSWSQKLSRDSPLGCFK